MKGPYYGILQLAFPRPRPSIIQIPLQGIVLNIAYLSEKEIEKLQDL